MNRSEIRDSSSYGTCDMMTNSTASSAATGRYDGGLTGNAITPGNCDELRAQLFGDLLLLARAVLPLLQPQDRVAVDDGREAGDRAVCGLSGIVSYIASIALRLLML